MNWTVTHGIRVADREIERFRSAMRGARLDTLVALNSRTFRAEVEGSLCIFRVLRRMTARTAARHANAFHRLARALSPHRMSSPAAAVEGERWPGLPADAQVVATEHGPSTYLDGDSVDGALMQRIGGKERQLGALLSYIAHLADHGCERNLLFSTASTGFPFWFVDLDFAFGDVMPWGYGKPLFYPGHRLDYRVRGHRGLPPLAKELVDWIGGQRTSAVAQCFGLSPAEAADLRMRCAKVVKLGLAAAIDGERFWQAEKTLYGRLKGRARAKVGKYLLSCRAAGHLLFRQDLTSAQRQLGLTSVSTREHAK